MDIIHQDRIDQTVSHQYGKILYKIDEMKQNQNSAGFMIMEKNLSRNKCLPATLRLWHFNNILDFTGINFPATLRDIDLFGEKNPNYAVNVFYPALVKNNKEQLTRNLNSLCISEYNYQREHMVDLILFTEEEEDLRDRCNINEIPPGLNTYYCLINGEIRKFIGSAHHDCIKIKCEATEEKLVKAMYHIEDSCQFQFPSLEKVASNLRDQEKMPEQLAKCFLIMAQSILQHLLPLKLTQKSEYSYELNKPEHFSRTKLPSKKEFNTVLSGLNYCDQGCKKCKQGKKCNGKCKEEDLKEVDDCEHEKIYTISQKQYDHTQNVWEKAECKTFGDYHDLYLRINVLILADSIQHF
ncbi:hypothetical protein C1645_734110 [Glomus cerebriforme]|uniref:Uncharacterized protein n=1 Tax=Glomus cerebriforme TaxID=658196 RepID=A0A397TAU3_9GLOM|nr:hypothetical protein C1645_734110 [Glomus cerebriforme]